MRAVGLATYVAALGGVAPPALGGQHLIWDAGRIDGGVAVGAVHAPPLSCHSGGTVHGGLGVLSPITCPIWHRTHAHSAWTGDANTISAVTGWQMPDRGSNRYVRTVARHMRA